MHRLTTVGSGVLRRSCSVVAAPLHRRSVHSAAVAAASVRPVVSDASPQSSATSAHASGCSCCSARTVRILANASAASAATATAATPRRSFAATTGGPTMRAQVLTKAGPEWTMCLEDLRRPEPKRGEVLIRVRATGVCHTDLHIMKAEVGFPVPAVMGHEISGEIVQIGEGVSAHAPIQLKVGQKVASPFIMPCGECRECVQGQEDLCSTFFALNRGKGQLYDGSTRLFRPDGTPIAMYSFGGIAQYCVVPATAVYPLPSNVPEVDAAILGCAVFTAYGAVRNVAKLQAGESVAVIGVGGVGINTVQMARAAGADRIIAIDVSDDKLQLASSLGATHTINALQENVLERVRQYTDMRGVNVAFEALGRRDTFTQAVNAVADGGRAVMVGIAPVGLTAEVEITRLVRRKIQVLGSFGAKARTDMPALLRMVEKGQIDITSAISRRFSLADADEAYRLLDKGKIIGRAVIDMQL